MTARLSDPDPRGVGDCLTPENVTPADVRRAIEEERAWQMHETDEKEAA